MLLPSSPISSAWSMAAFWEKSSNDMRWARRLRLTIGPVKLLAKKNAQQQPATMDSKPVKIMNWEATAALSEIGDNAWRICRMSPLFS